MAAPSASVPIAMRSNRWPGENPGSVARPMKYTALMMVPRTPFRIANPWSTLTRGSDERSILTTGPKRTEMITAPTNDKTVRKTRSTRYPTSLFGTSA